VSVLFDDAWPQRVERRLARERGERWEAVNLAEPGLNAVQEASRLASEGFAYEPDVVIVAYVLNDSEDETAAEARRAADWVEEQRLGRPCRSWTARRSPASCGPGSGPRSRTAGGSRASAPCTPTTTRMGGGPARPQAMGGMCRERGVPLVVAIFRSSGTPWTPAILRGRPREGGTGGGGGGGPGGGPPLRVPRPRRDTARGERSRRRAPQRDRPPDRRAGDRPGVDEVIPRSAAGAAPP